MSEESPAAEVTVYEAVGGMPFFERLVGRFYDHVEADPVLLALYPDQDDLGPARERLTLFLAQYWGGPTDLLRRARPPAAAHAAHAVRHRAR